MTSTEVLVIGAGPAGIAAATAAAELGRTVIVLDDNAAAGGQIWRDGIPSADSFRNNHGDKAKHTALARLANSGARVLSAHRVFDVTEPQTGPQTVHALHEGESAVTAVRFQYEHLILATGARERFLPFPGWTLPGVFGAGGLQALVKGGFRIAGKRVVVAGTGPLLLAVAAHLRGDGAHIVSVAEQASLAQLAPFAASLLLQPGKIVQGLRYRSTLGSTPYRTHCWPVAAVGDATNSKLLAVQLTDGKHTWQEPCELLACGFHLVPNTELAALLGCTFHGGFVQVDEEQRTSRPRVFCVGEPTGIAGLEAALVQGEIAGRAAAGQQSPLLQKRAAAERSFGLRLAKAFALRSQLKLLATPETIICRCEDVPLSKLTPRTGWTDAKLQTRCGMGPCQGRICGPAVEALLGWEPQSVRPPLFPVPLASLCTSSEKTAESTAAAIKENA